METQAFTDLGTPETSSIITTSVKTLFFKRSDVFTDAVLLDEESFDDSFGLQTFTGPVSGSLLTVTGCLTGGLLSLATLALGIEV